MSFLSEVAKLAIAAAKVEATRVLDRVMAPALPAPTPAPEPEPEPEPPPPEPKADAPEGCWDCGAAPVDGLVLCTPCLDATLARLDAERGARTAMPQSGDAGEKP